MPFSEASDKPLTYAGYLKIDELLRLQQPLSEGPEHDEMLFIIIHQVYELWFKQLLWETDAIKRKFSSNDLYGAIATFQRMRTIMKTLVGQLDILETMTPVSFVAFRERLESASGFQSSQYRELEYVLGYKRSEMLHGFEPDTEEYRRLNQRLDEPSVIDCFYDLLEARAVEIPAALRQKDPQRPRKRSQAFQASHLPGVKGCCRIWSVPMPAGRFRPFLLER